MEQRAPSENSVLKSYRTPSVNIKFQIFFIFTSFISLRLEIIAFVNNSRHSDGGGIYGGFTALTEDGTTWTSICFHILKKGPTSTALKKHEFEAHSKAMLDTINDGYPDQTKYLVLDMASVNIVFKHEEYFKVYDLLHSIMNRIKSLRKPGVFFYVVTFNY